MGTTSDRCKVCDSIATFTLMGPPASYLISCPKCGHYEITDTALKVWDEKEIGGVEISRLLKEHSTEKYPIKITSYNCKNLVTSIMRQMDSKPTVIKVDRAIVLIIVQILITAAGLLVATVGVLVAMANLFRHLNIDVIIKSIT